MSVIAAGRCANCFAELPEPGACFSCGWFDAGNETPNALARLTTLQSERYTLGRVLGAGGFGVTYAALDNSTGGLVAIKEYMPSALAERQGLEVAPLPGYEKDFKEGYRRFEKEWRILSSLGNIKSIVRGIGFFAENHSLYIVMERLTGADIRTLLKETAPQEVLPFCELVVRNIGSALVEVHNRGIVHLDVSPANIFFQSDGSLRLIDFGSAIFVNDEAPDTVQLKHGYAPPELYSLKTPKGSWTDVYALAATFYNLVSGLKVPPAETRLARDDLLPLEDLNLRIPPHISNSVGRALSLDLSARYKTVIEFLHDFTDQPPLGGKSPAQPLMPETGVRATPFFRAGQEKEPAAKKPQQEKAAEVIGRLGQLLTSINPKRLISAGPPPEGAARQESPAIIAQSKRFGSFRVGLNPGTTHRVGRVSGPGMSDFVVTDDPRISKVHLTVRFDRRQRMFAVTDQSTNGTFFQSGERLRAGVEYLVYPGDTVFLASRECSIRLIVD